MIGARTGLRTGWGLLALLWLLALGAPLLANHRPLVQHSEAGIYFPALADLPLLGRLVEPNPPAPGPHDLVVRALLPYDPTAPDLDVFLQPPGWRHPLGTDELGRDVAARLLYGAQVSLAVGAGGTLASLLIGLVLGGLAGHLGGRTDAVISTLVDVALCFPSLLLALALVSLTSARGPLALILVLAATRWARIARFARGEFLRLRRTDLVRAARAGGAGESRIMARHLLPNALAPVLVTAAFSAAGAILLEASLGFLGLGVQPPLPSWGGMLAGARNGGAWWLVVFPGLTVFAALAAYGLIGEGMLDRLDPQRRQGATTARAQAV
jgi:peptide/nickel transport system permease protein